MGRGFWHIIPMRRWLENRFAELRPRKTRAGLARVLGVEPPQITMMVKGERRIQTKEVQKIASYLEWSKEIVLAHIANDDEPPPPKSREKLSPTLTSPVNPERTEAGHNDLSGKTTGEKRMTLGEIMDILAGLSDDAKDRVGHVVLGEWALEKTGRSRRPSGGQS